MKVPYSEQVLKERVRKYRILWDHTIKSHFKKNLQDKAWCEVASGFEERFADADFCRSEFSRLRENRGQRKRRMKKRVKSGAGGGGPAENFLADDMAWLDEVGADMSSFRESNINFRRGSQRDAVPNFFDEENPDDPDGDGDAASSGAGAVSIRFAANQAGTGCCTDSNSGELQHPAAPSTPSSAALQQLGQPSAASSPRALRNSPAGSLLGRSRRVVRPPTRFSPSDVNLLNDSNASNASNASGASGRSASSRASVRGRRGRRPTQRQVRGNSPVALDTIHEESTVLGDISHGTSAGGNSLPNSSPGVRVRPQAVQVVAQVHAVNVGPNSPRPQRPPVRRRLHTPGHLDEMEQIMAASPVQDAGFGPLRTPQSHSRRGGRGTPRSGRRTPGSRRGPQRGRAPNARPGRVDPDLDQRRQARADVRRARGEERDREARAVQLQHEARRAALRDNIAAQAELARGRHIPHDRDRAREEGVAALETAETALLRQFLTEKNRDVYGCFGETVASLLRGMTAPVSGKAMVETMAYLNNVANMTDQEREQFLAEPLSID